MNGMIAPAAWGAGILFCLTVGGHIQDTGLNFLDRLGGVQRTATHLAVAENMTTEERLKELSWALDLSH